MMSSCKLWWNAPLRWSQNPKTAKNQPFLAACGFKAVLWLRSAITMCAQAQKILFQPITVHQQALIPRKESQCQFQISLPFQQLRFQSKVCPLQPFFQPGSLPRAFFRISCHDVFTEVCEHALGFRGTFLCFALDVATNRF